MKKILYTLILICFSLTVFAQNSDRSEKESLTSQKQAQKTIKKESVSFYQISYNSSFLLGDLKKFFKYGYGGSLFAGNIYKMNKMIGLGYSGVFEFNYFPTLGAEETLSTYDFSSMFIFKFYWLELGLGYCLDIVAIKLPQHNYHQCSWRFGTNLSAALAIPLGNTWALTAGVNYKFIIPNRDTMPDNTNTIYNVHRYGWNFNLGVRFRLKTNLSSQQKKIKEKLPLDIHEI